MGKYKILAPIGGKQNKIWMPGEVAGDEKEFRAPVADLIRDGFIASVEGEDIDTEKDKNPEGGNEGGVPPTIPPVVGAEGSGSGDSGEEDTTTAEIKAQLDYEGIKYPANASKRELFEIYQNK